jgi:cellulose synthase/poly-beta-1,6-N-acetylglucosamine synthase-like glycosyltransferase
VVARLVARLTELDYPPAKLDIKLVLETGDDMTRQALEELALPAHFELIVAPPGEPKTKPRALNVALPLARGRHLVVYDAEDQPEAGQLRAAVACFSACDDSVACLQARLAIDNTDDGWLTRFFTVEYAALFDVVNPALARLGLPIPLGGTSNHFRTDVLRQAGGWDAWNVTEDADLGIRLARLGYRTEDLPSTTLEDAPSDLCAWMRQRSRWLKGYWQTCITHSRHPLTTFRELGGWGFAAAAVVLFGTVLSALAYPVLAAVAALTLGEIAARGPDSLADAIALGAASGLFALGFAAMAAPAAVALHRRGLIRLYPFVLLLPFYYVLVSAAAWIALWKLMVDPFSWSKTEHAAPRTSRSAAARDGMPRGSPS